MLAGMNASTQPRRQRVPALSADDRRVALVAATIPLLREHGVAVSTRQIADAAGVAEGTIFGVFSDKASLIRAAVIAALDPAATLRALEELRAEPDLRTRLESCTTVIGQRMFSNAKLMMFARTDILPRVAPEAAGELSNNRRAMVESIAALMEPERDLLRYPPAVAARVLLSTIAAAASGIFDEPAPIDSRQIVSILLDGLMMRSYPDPGESTC